MDAPLDMRFSQHTSLTAQTIIKSYSSEQLEKMLISYGDFSPKTANYLAKGIVEARDRLPLETT
jgi:16S rRNA C1402 N4-methylase RsmH